MEEKIRDKLIKIGASKTFSVADNISIKSRREDDNWGAYDEDWGFRIHDIPVEFRTEKKYENFILAKEEEVQKKLVLKSKPYNVVIEPTNACNLHCPLCSTGLGAQTRKKGILDFENFKKLIDEIKECTLELSLQNWGEPTLVHDLPKMIRYAANSGIYTRLSTNFSVNYQDAYLEEIIKSGLGILVIDLDGTTQEIYEKYRVGGKLETVIENTKKAVSIKKANKLKFPILQTRMIVTSYNEHQIADFNEISKKLGVDEIELGNIQLNPNTAKKWLPKNKNYVYETYLGEHRVTPCHWPWSSIVINWDGGVSPCCIIDDQNSDFGNVFKNTIMEVWNNEYYVSARSEFSDTKQMTKFTICNMCKNDTHNPNLFRVGDSFSITMNQFTPIKNQTK
jgi:radical SAM protein with 4Fe4S-binding SPASM domain